MTLSLRISASTLVADVLVEYTSNFALGLAVPMPTDPELVAKLAPVVLDNAPVTASPVEVNSPINELLMYVLR